MSIMGYLASDFDDSHAWVFDTIPRVLPASWVTMDRRPDGVSWRLADGMTVIASGARELDGKRWLHVSFARHDRLPSYDDLRLVKDTVIGRDRTALQVFPPAAKHVNIHGRCLHLWTCIDGDVTPDFTRGGDTI